MTTSWGASGAGGDGGRWRYPGARWWKCDLHAHTPASRDYGKGTDQASLRQIAPRDWLLNFMRAGVDCVAVTDHNSGEWFDRLREALGELERDAHPDFLPLHLFPGVEISAGGGVHILAILDADKSSADIAALLGTVGYRGQWGASDVAANSAPTGVVEAIGNAGGIPILAHVDGPSGAWGLAGSTLAPLLDAVGLFAMEVVDPRSVKPESYRQRRLDWAEVLGSDSHHPSQDTGTRFPGSHYTWIKMAAPSLPGLRLALLDGKGFSVRRSDEPEPFDPCALPEHFVEEVEIDCAQYMGRGVPARFTFSPWLNALVGGRGTGKSTVVHALRLAARREHELKRLDERSQPRVVFQAFARVPTNRSDRGGLTRETKIRWTVMRDGVRYRVRWGQDADRCTVEEETPDGTWSASPVQSVTGDRFPIRLFSQGQIAALAGENQQALMQVIDEAAGATAPRERLQEARDAFLALRARIRELDGRLRRRDEVVVQQQDVERKLKRFEEAGHAEILTSYRRRNRQRVEADRQIEEAAAMADHIERVAAELEPADPPDGLFDADEETDRQATAVIAALAADVRTAASSLQDSARRLREAAESQGAGLRASAWQSAVDGAAANYRNLIETLCAEGVSDPSEYGHLTQVRQLLDGERARLDSVQEERDRLVREAREQLAAMQEARRGVSGARNAFLEQTLSQNPFVRIRSRAYGDDPRVIERSLREALDVLDDRFSADILVLEDDQPRKGVVADLLDELPEDPAKRSAALEARIAGLKARLERACTGNGDFGGHFNNLLARESQRRPALLDHLLTWFPEDALRIDYNRAGDGTDFRPIAQASAGQRSAAMLAFLLAHGTEALVLDQPEDDLDNHLIYDLIVRLIRKNKVQRQIIVVTHNPNIVVNGDAEMLHALDFRRGQCVIAQCGSLQDEAMREEVCRVMEGGREAFGRRYRRLGRKPTDV